MALTARKNRLRCFIQSMHDEGIVNDQFFQLQSMKEVIRRDYVVRAITSFCVSCIRLFSTLTDQIYQQEVDFQEVHVLARELYARITGVGAENVKRVCAEPLYASEMKDKNHCYQALYRIKNEFSYLRRKLETLVQVTIVARFSAVGGRYPGRLFWMLFCKLQEILEKISGNPLIWDLTRALIPAFQNSVCLPRFSFVRMTLRARCRWNDLQLVSGVVNDQFNAIVSRQYIRDRDRGERDRVVQLIETYLADVDMILSALSRYVDNSEVDFGKLASLAREIEDKSISIGAEHMRLACPDIIKACDEKNQISFSQTLLWLKNEFINTRNKLDSFAQMELRIIRAESSQPRN